MELLTVDHVFNTQSNGTPVFTDTLDWITKAPVIFSNLPEVTANETSSLQVLSAHNNSDIAWRTMPDVTIADLEKKTQEAVQATNNAISATQNAQDIIKSLAIANEPNIETLKLLATSYYGVSYNEDTGYFQYSGLMDITSEQMAVMIANAVYDYGHPSNMAFMYANNPARANLFPRQCWDVDYGQTSMYNFCANTQFEVLYIPNKGDGIKTSNARNAFDNSSKLRRIIGYIDLSNVTTADNMHQIFKGCTSLEDCDIRKIKIDISFADCPSLTAQSVYKMLYNGLSDAELTNPVTITLHESAYNRAIQDPDVLQQLENHTKMLLAKA